MVTSGIDRISRHRSGETPEQHFYNSRICASIVVVVFSLTLGHSDTHYVVYTVPDTSRDDSWRWSSTGHRHMRYPN